MPSGALQQISIHALREEGDLVPNRLLKPCLEFLSTPSARRATKGAGCKDDGGRISIHALREEGDRLRRCSCLRRSYFYPRPPRGGRRARGSPSCRWCRFLSTPSARRATSVWMVFMSELQNFYPRPPRGGRQSPCGRACNPRDFYPRPPRGGRLSTNGIPAAAFRFLSTPSARRATKDGNKKGFEWQISIHALREEGDVCDGLDNRAAEISIHALREEGDLGKADLNVGEGEFLSTPSARRATVDIKTHADRDDISIHALREEGDHGGGDTMTQWSISIHALREEGDVKRSHLPGAGDNFYPRPPRGGRQPPARVVPRRGQFLSTPSARRATTLPPLPCAWLANFYPRPPRGGRRRCSKAPTSSRTISIHALREEGDAAGLPGKARPPYFYPRPPRGGRQGRAKRVFQGRNISIHALREEGDLHRSGRGRGQRPISIHALREEGDAGV